VGIRSREAVFLRDAFTQPGGPTPLLFSDINPFEKRAPQLPRTHRQKSRPFTFRLSADERWELEQRAGGQTLGSYVRACLFGDGVSTRRSLPLPDRKALAGLLARLGQSDIAANLRIIAEAARNGSLPITPETLALIEQACRDIAAMKSMLMKALRIKER
jgi:hypothetical protein